jgi:hypothetical protein
MSTKTFCRWLPFVLALTLVTTCLWSKSPDVVAAEKEAHVTVSVYNEAGVPSDVLGQAEEEAWRVFQRAGIEVQWLNCKLPAPKEEVSSTCQEAAFPDHLHLRVVPRSLGLKGEAMGISFQAEDGRGCYADLFYKPMEDLHKTDGTDVASLLGHVAAHEIGHLLLGTNSHAAAGIMHAHWTAEELASTKIGGLLFLDKEARQMREKLLSAAHIPGGKSAAIVARVGD